MTSKKCLHKWYHHSQGDFWTPEDGYEYYEFRCSLCGATEKRNHKGRRRKDTQRWGYKEK